MTATAGRTRPVKSVGTDEGWAKATAALKKALESVGLPYQVDEGGGAFYGPKIDVKIKDMLGRTWQCSTIQCDFNLPERFDMTYIDASGNKAYYATFVGSFPAEDPQVTILVSIDEPNSESNDRFGGTASAPLFADLAQITISELGVKPPVAPPAAEGT